MFASKCVITGKPGIKDLNHLGAYSVIANKELFDHGKASKYAIINTQKAWVESVYLDFNKASSALRSLG
jgi:hypothetical protein